jgi:hypothetical protein
MFTSVNSNEIKFILCFDDIHSELLLPEYALKGEFSKTTIRKIQNSLIKKGVITNTKPLRLTKLGKKIKKEQIKIKNESNSSSFKATAERVI